MDKIEEMILQNICNFVAIKLGKVSVSIEEVDAIYDSGKYPEINAGIDYVLNAGQKTLDKFIKV